MSANLEREAQERKRRERLAVALRENLKRRKAQLRGRSMLDSPANSAAPRPNPADARSVGEGTDHGSD